MEDRITIPLDVPYDKKEDWLLNYRLATYENRGMFVLAGDQRVEHLNDDFVGKGVSEQDKNPEHLFQIADETVGIVFATQLGLVASYGGAYRRLNYLVKLNSKTNLVKDKDPQSELLNTVEEVVALQKESCLKIIGVGYTVYLGSEYEPRMLKTAAQVIRKAHENGLLSVLWVYPRGKAVKKPQDPHLLAGACAVAGSLGTDFIKVECPKKKKARKKFFQEAIQSAGRAKIICAGGESVEPKKFLEIVANEIKEGAFGIAVGRNLHQKDLTEAVRLAKALKALVIEKKTLKEIFY